MKTNLLIPIVALSVINGFSQAIPNGGFENWSGISITLPIIGAVGYEELDGWKSTNAIAAALGGASPVVKSPNSYKGTYSLQVGTIETQTLSGKDTVSGVLTTTFKVKAKPVSLDGYYRSALKGFKDSIGIIATAIHVDPVTKASFVIGTSVFLIDKTKANFTDFTSPFVYTNQSLSVDSVSILIISANAKKANKTPNTFIWLDELSLQYAIILALDQETNPGTVRIYPNPASGNVSIVYKGGGNATAEILNENGLIVKKINQPNVNLANIDISELEAGVYFVRLVTDNTTTLRKLIVN
jgi:hypothetical protein